MAKQNYTNTASVATVSGSTVSSGATSMTVANFSGWPSVPFWAIVNRGTVSAEVVKVTNVAGSTLTISRGQDGTTASSHNVGETVEHIIPAYAANLAESHPEVTTGAHGITGDPVGTTQAQTLTNKTYRGAHTAVFSDTTPAFTAGFSSTADNTNAKDGFVHANTAADPDRAAFRATQAGADRFVVFNDGTAQITPSGSAVRPTLNVTGGATTIGGTLAVTGAQTNTGLVTANGGATVDNTLTVKKTLDLIEQTSGGTPRLNIRTNALQRAIEIVRASDLTVRVYVDSDGQIVSVAPATFGSVTATGQSSAQAAKTFSYANGNYGSWKGAYSSPAITRDIRQPTTWWVSGASINATITGSVANLYVFTFTAVTDANVEVTFSCGVRGTTAGTGNNAALLFAELQTSGGVAIEGSSPSMVVSTVGTGENAGPVMACFGSAVTAGTTYRVAVRGNLFSGTCVLQSVTGTIKEVARVN